MLPLPPVLLDVLFTFNIVLSLIVVTVAVSAGGRWTSRCSRPCSW